MMSDLLLWSVFQPGWGLLNPPNPNNSLTFTPKTFHSTWQAQKQKERTSRHDNTQSCDLPHYGWLYLTLLVWAFIWLDRPISYVWFCLWLMCVRKGSLLWVPDPMSSSLQSNTALMLTDAFSFGCFSDSFNKHFWENSSSLLIENN